MPPDPAAASPAPTPGAAPQAGSTPQGQPPFGSSPATGPTQNRGYEVAGLKKLGLIVDMAGEVLPLVGAASDAGQALVKAIGSLAKFVPPGSVSPADKEQMLKQMLIKNQQNTQMVSQLQQQQQKPAAPGGGAPGAAPGGAPAGAPGMPKAA